MQTPQIIFIVLVAMSGAITIVKHGKAKGNYSFLGWVFAAVIEIGILKWGGFFG